MDMHEECVASISSHQPQNQHSPIVKLHPDKVPILLLKSPKSRLKTVDNNKLLISKEFKVHRVLALIRNKIMLGKEEALYLFAERTLLQPGQTLAEVEEKYKGEDGYLRLEYYEYETFG